LVEEVWAGHGADRRLEVHIPPEPIPAHADPDLLRYLLSNLLTNAAKFSASGGLVEFTLQRNNGEVVFRVQDEGIGIPKADLYHVFKPFHRARNAETIPGTGLGLSIAQRAVELHGGTLSIESEEGSGTVVAVSIPISARKGFATASV
jgi:signal transduction histidine kinase